MIIENSFDVGADPDRVFDFLQNPHNVAACFPGAELTEDLGDDQYKGKVKIKLGPVTAAFTGVAKITEKDDVARIAVLVAEGKDARGSGTAKATATMRVEPKEDAGASVLLKTDLTISGKLAQFGRGIMADVSNRMVGDLAERVRERIEAEAGPGDGPAPEDAPAEAAPAASAAAPAGSTAEPAAESAGGSTADSSGESAATPGAATGTAMETPTEKGTKGTEKGAEKGTATAAAAAATAAGEPESAIKASTLLKVMISGLFRRLVARLRGRSAESHNG